MSFNREKLRAKAKQNDEKRYAEMAEDFAKVKPDDVGTTETPIAPVRTADKDPSFMADFNARRAKDSRLKSPNDWLKSGVLSPDEGYKPFNTNDKASLNKSGRIIGGAAGPLITGAQKSKTNTTSGDGLTDNERSSQISALRSRARELLNQNNAYKTQSGRSSGIGSRQGLIDKNEQEISKINARIRELERGASHTQYEDYKRDAADAASAYKDTKNKYIQSGRGDAIEARENRENNPNWMKEYTAAGDASRGAQRVLDRVDYVNKYADRAYEDNFTGQYSANKLVGRLTQDQSLAWTKYIDDPTPENKAYAEAIDQLITQAQINNENVLDDEGNILPWVSKSLANYMPQFLDQLKYQGVSGLIGAGVGSAFGAPDIGAKAGVIAGSGAYSWKTMRGAAFKNLLDMGVNEDVAREAANDEALISTMIEMADTGIDLFTLGTGKVINMITGGGLKALIKKGTEATAKNSIKKYLAILAKYGVNIAGEGLEEETQEAVSIANENRVVGGNSGEGLAGDAWDVFWDDYVMGEDKDNHDRIAQAGAEGRKIAAMMGGATIAGTSIAPNVIQNAADTRTGKQFRNQWGTDYNEAVQELIATGKEFSDDTASNRLANKLQGRLDAGKQLQPRQVTSLWRSNVLAQQQIERAADTLGKNGSKAFKKAIVGYESDSDKIFSEFAKIYNLGKKADPDENITGSALDTRLPETPNLNASQRFTAYASGMNDAAYLAGQADAKYNENINYTETEELNNVRTESVDDSGRRLESLDTGEQGRSLAERAGRNQEWKVQAQRSKSRFVAAEAQGLRQVSTAELGLSYGTDRTSVRVLPADFDEEVSVIHEQAAADGVKVVCVAGDFEVNTAGGVRLANGTHIGNTIYVSMTDKRYSGTQIYKHEQTHDIIARERAENNGASPTFERVRREILAHDDGELREMMSAYEKRYHCVDDVIDEDYILEEIICDANAGIDIFAGSDTMEGATKYSDTVRAAFGEVHSESKKAATSKMGGGVKYSINPDFVKQLDSWDGISNRIFRVGTTSKALKSIGIKDSGIIWYGQKIAKILKKHEGMTRDIIKQVPEILENPIVVLKSKQSDSRIVIFGEITDNNGAPVTTILELQPTTKGGQLLNMNVIASAYGKDSNPAAFIRNSDLLYLDPNRNRTDSWFDAVGLQLPSVASNHYGSVGTISYHDGKVKIDGLPYTQFMQDGENNSAESGVNSSSYIAKKKSAAPMSLQKAQDQTSETLGGYSSTDSIRNDSEKSNSEFSLKSETDLEKQVAKLAEQNERLREQFKVSTDIKTNRKSVERLAKSLNETYSSNANTDTLVKGMTELYDYIANNRGEDISWDEVKGRAVMMAADIVDNASVLNDDMYKVYSDLRSRLRGQTIKISRYDAHDIADFNDFRKSQFGRFNVSHEKGLPIDSLYRELSEAWPEWFNEEEVSAPSDQLLHIADVLDGLQPVYENPFSYNMRCATEMVANDIIESFYDVPQQAPTYADRMTAKVEAAKAKGKQDVSDLLEEKNEKISDMISKEKHAQQIEALRENKNERIADIRERQRNNTDWLLMREKMRREGQVGALKEHYAEIRANQRARRADSASKTRLLHIAKRLQNKKLPAVQRGLLNQYIGELDTVAKSMTGQTLEKLTDLREWYEKQRDNNPDFIADPRIEKQLARLSQRQISDLSIEEVEVLTEVLLNIENEIRTHRKLIDEQDGREIYHMGIQVIEDIGNTRGTKGKGVKNALDTYIVTETLSPTRELRRMTGYVDSDPLYVLTNSLADGQRKSFDYQMRASKKFDKFTQDKKFMNYLTGKNAEGIEITGISGKEGPVTVTISPAMRISLYLHSLNDQNLKHIAGGGITVPDWELYKAGKLSEAYSRGKTIKLTPSQVRKIRARMSEKERAFGRAVYAYFNGQSRDEINEVSEKLKGYSLAQIEDYYPINTDSSFTRKEFDAIKFDGTIENQGWTKERINAASPIYLRDVNDVTLRAVKQHGDYVGLAIPMRNFNKVWGVTKSSFNEDGSRNNFESSVQAAVRAKWGDAGYNYVEKMISDLSPTRKQADVWGKALSKVRSNYAKAVLTLNLSVAMKQAASYPTAAAVLGWRPINRAMVDVGKVDLTLIEKYTPLQWYRSQGFTTQELGDLASKDKSLPSVLNWVQHIDLMTTRKLWKASEYYVRYNKKNLRVGSEEYCRAVADIYNRVIEETQPNYTTMQRPQLLRSDNQLMQSLAMFKTQPFQNFNILYDATGNLLAKRAQYRVDGGAEAGAAYKAAKTAFGRAVTSQVAQLAVFAAMTLAWNALRGKWDKYKDDEDDDPTLKSILKGLGKDMVGGAFGTIPWGSDVYELGASIFAGDTYYGLDAVVPSAISDALTAIKNFSAALDEMWDDITAGDEKVDWKKQAHNLDDMFDSVSKVLGIPYENVTNLYAIVFEKTASAIHGKTLGKYYTMQNTKDMSKSYNQQKAYDLLYKAYSGSDKDYETLYNEMIDDGFEEEKIRNAIESREKDAQGVKSVTDLSSRYLAPQEQDEYDAYSNELKRNALWRQVPKTQQDYAYDMIYGLATGSESSDVKAIREKASEGTAYGVSETEMILLKVALEMYDENQNGNYNKAETQAAIDAISGLSQEERAYMFGITNKSKYNPYE